MVKDGGNQEIGVLAGISEGGPAFAVITQQGYSFWASFETGTSSIVKALIYATTDCSGVAYAQSRNGLVVSGFNPDLTTSLYYTEKSSLVVSNFTAGSISDNSGCNVFNGALSVWPVILNDPVVTGIPSSGFTVPITLQRAQ